MIESSGVVCPGRLPAAYARHAYVTRDMAATRTFYEDLIGLPLVATWCESDVLFGKLRTCCHCFALPDGSALTFFQFARDEVWREFGRSVPTRRSSTSPSRRTRPRRRRSKTG